MTTSKRQVAAFGVVVSLSLSVLAACGDGDTETGDAAPATDEQAADGETVTLTVEPSAIPAFVADRRDLFGDTDVEVTTVGYEEAESLLLAGQTQIAWMGPLDAARFASEGEVVQYLSTAGALNMHNGVVVRAEDSEKYQDITDLQGQKLGIPGFGTGTWANFEVFTSSFMGIEDPRSDFDIVTADSGALLALLERGEIEGALLFAAQSAAGRYMPQFETIFSFTENMEEEFGVPLVVNGAVAERDWIEANPEAVEDVISGLDEAVRWMTDNPEAFLEDGEYADLANGDGWHASEETATGITNLVGEGAWYLTSDDYTQEWQDAVYQLIEAGEGTLVESVPAKEDVFADVD